MATLILALPPCVSSATRLTVSVPSFGGARRRSPSLAGTGGRTVALTTIAPSTDANMLAATLAGEAAEVPLDPRLPPTSALDRIPDPRDNPLTPGPRDLVVSIEAQGRPPRHCPGLSSSRRTKNVLREMDPVVSRGWLRPEEKAPQIFAGEENKEGDGRVFVEGEKRKELTVEQMTGFFPAWRADHPQIHRLRLPRLDSNSPPDGQQPSARPRVSREFFRRQEHRPTSRSRPQRD